MSDATDLPATEKSIESAQGDKPKAARRSKSSTAPAQSKTDSTMAKSPKPKQKKHSEQEKLAKIKQIENAITEESMTLKDAVKNAGISDETYYQWKRSAKIEPETPKVGRQPAASASQTGDRLEDLLELEEENQRLRKTLAEKLRAENAALRKKLGIA